MIVENKQILRWVIFPTAKVLKLSPRTVYLQCGTAKFLLTHIRRPFYTYTIDLSKTPVELLASYSGKLRQHIRRAEAANIKIERDEDPTAVIDLFRPIAQIKQLSPINKTIFASKTDFIITRAIHPKLGILAAHAYQYDRDNGIVRGLYNASKFRDYHNNQALRSLCSQANAILYHKDFVFFHRQRYHTYDFGGYSMGANPGADYFKDRFKGKIVKQYNYFPWWYFAFRQLRKAWKNWHYG